MNKEGPTIDDPEAVCNTNPTMFARIAIELALDREFDYRIPASLSDDVKLGSYVKVPFGRSSRTGFVTAITESSDVDPKKMKDILEIIGNRPLLKPGVLEMCRFMAAYYVALFAPVDNLGLIVVDEEHEPSYKQDQSPRYHARDMAVLRAQFDQCPVLLGSATPSIESYQNTINHKYRAVHLAQRVDDRAMPSVRVVDLRQEQEREGRPVLFSRDLIEAMEIRLNQHEQIILFLNRRGYATSHLCVACGYVCECEECGVAMTYHRRIDYLRCHLCGQGMEIPSSCPECKKPEFKVAGIGTERVEDIIRKFFPHANVRRADSDTMTTRRSHEDLMRQFRGGKIDILVGTQMIAKGLDFPNVTLVGVINADRTLHMPDFRAAERTFQLLTQVAGRAGRGEIAGEVIVQTYTPEHPAIQAAKQQDYKAFFDYELEFRRELHYPPFSRLAAVTVRGKDEALVRESTETFHKHWLERLGDAEGVWLNDACPAAIERVGGVYRYQVLGRAINVGDLTRPLRALFTNYRWPTGVVEGCVAPRVPASTSTTRFICINGLNSLGLRPL